MDKIEIQLRDKDYIKIMDIAIEKWQNSSFQLNNKSTLTKCYVEAFLEYSNKNNLLTEIGKVYKIE